MDLQDYLVHQLEADLNYLIEMDPSEMKDESLEVLSKKLWEAWRVIDQEECRRLDIEAAEEEEESRRLNEEAPPKRYLPPQEVKEATKGPTISIKENYYGRD